MIFPFFGLEGAGCGYRGFGLETVFSGEGKAGSLPNLRRDENGVGFRNFSGRREYTPQGASS
jgi:hypothetical protein